MTKADAILKYHAVRRSNGKWLYLFFGALILPFLVTLTVGYLVGSREIAGGVFVVLFIIAFPVALSYFVWRCNKEFERNGLCCSFCGTPFDGRTIATCKCRQCGQTVMEDSDVPEQSRVLFSISFKALFCILLVVLALALAIMRLK